MSPTSFQTAPSRDKCYLLKRRMGRGGFEPPKQVAADLQSVPFGHSGICPFITKQYKIDLLHSSITWIVKADDRTRTDNLLITNQLLCQLSHIGMWLSSWFVISCSAYNWLVSRQLSRNEPHRHKKWKLQGSNLWPSACKADALPAELNFQNDPSGTRTRDLRRDRAAL